MFHTIDRLSKCLLTIFFILLGIGGILGVSFFELRVSIIDSLLVFIAFAEAGLLLAGLVEFQHRLLSIEEKGE